MRSASATRKGKDALVVLGDAALRFDGGPLAPERVALERCSMSMRGDVARGAELLTRAERVRGSRSLDDARITVRARCSPTIRAAPITPRWRARNQVPNATRVDALRVAATAMRVLEDRARAPTRTTRRSSKSNA